MIPLPKKNDTPHACSRQESVALRRQLLGFGSNVRRPLRFTPPFVTFCPVIQISIGIRDPTRNVQRNNENCYEKPVGARGANGFAIQIEAGLLHGRYGARERD